MRSGSSRAMNRCYVPNVPPTSKREPTEQEKFSVKDLRAEYNKATENGTKVCGSCACFKNEDANGVGECEYPEDHKNRTNCLDINHGSNYCENWTKKTERDPATQNITAPAPRGKKIARKLSRREWFAGMALQGIMASNDCGIGHIPEKAAQWAVRVADAICRELDAPEE